MLRDQFDTFVAAGKTFAAHEHSSTFNFDTLAKPKDVTSNVTPPKLSSNGGSLVADLNQDLVDDSWSMPSFPEAIQGYGGKTDSVTINIENPDSLDWDQMIQLGQTIHAQPPMDLSGFWDSMSKLLSSNMATYADQIAKLQASWTGTASAAAVTAVRNYKDSTQDLIDAIKVTGASLRYTSDWLEATRKSMPTPGQPEKTGCKHHHTDEYRANYKKYYAEPMKSTISTIPTIAIPELAEIMLPCLIM